MGQKFIPDLAHMLFGNEYGEYACPEFVTSGLNKIAEAMAIDSTSLEYTPFENTGTSFANDVFEAHSYWWGDEEAPEARRPNFKCGDFEVYWYKYLGRDMSMNKDISEEDFNRIVDMCIKSLKEEQHNGNG